MQLIRQSQQRQRLDQQREDGVFEIEHSARIWLVSPDCRTLIGVKTRRRSRLVEPDGPSAAIVV
ncbi:hypothetical protein [Rhodococcus pyridinivorans]